MLLLALLYGLLHLTPVQNWLVQRVAANLSEKLHARISIRHIDLDLFDKLELKGLYVEDQHRDTLLYAGSASIRITDWFFLKDKATIHYLSLSDATVNLNRMKDTVWNYQFLVDYFAGGPKKDKKGGLSISLRELHLKNIAFNEVDKWKGKDQLLSLGRLDLAADTFDLDRQLISIRRLDIDKPSFTINDYTGIRDRLNIKPVPKVKTTDSLAEKGGLVLAVKELNIRNGTFANEKENTERGIYSNQFDGSHIRFEQINADLQHVRFARDSLTAAVVLATRERSGFEVKKLQADLLFSPEIMEFRNLDLQTNQSRLGNYYSMRYEDFNEDMGHFLHNVKLEGNFRDSELYSDDLAFFDPAIKSWKRVFRFSGKARGSIDNLVAKEMKIQSGNSRIEGDITLRGLPDINYTFIDLNARDFSTTYQELLTVVPSLKSLQQPRLSNLGNIRYKGNFTGFLNDFVAYGTIQTQLGAVTADLNLKLPAGQKAVYSGRVSTQQFQLGNFLNTPQLGAITFNGQVKGSGLSAPTLDARFDGDIRQLEFNGYPYVNISVKGDFRQRMFSGAASIDDPSLQLNNLTGTIDFNRDEPQFDFTAQLGGCNLQKLGFTRDQVELKGLFNFHFSGDDIDHFLGNAQVQEATLLYNQTALPFDSLVLQSSVVDGRKLIELRSNEADARISGDFKIAELPGAFTTFLHRYYPAYIRKPAAGLSGQDFSFEIHTRQVSPYIRLLAPGLDGFDNSTLSGQLRLSRNELEMTADIPSFRYGDQTFKYVRMENRGNFDSLYTKVDVEEMQVTDSLKMPFTNLEFTSANDTSRVRIKTSAGSTLSDASVNATVITLSDGVKIHFSPSSFIINENKWELEKDGELVISGKQVQASDIRFVQGEQQISVSTHPSELLNTNDVVVELSQVHVDDFSTLFFNKPALQGSLTGTVTVEDPFGKPFLSFNTRTAGLKMDNDSLGTLTAAGNYQFDKGLLTLKARTDAKDNQLNIDGQINFRDTTGNNTRIAVQSDQFNLSLLNAYLGDLFSDIRGTANTSDLLFSGNGKHLLMTGTANILEGSLVVDYTQCRYRFRNESIVFNPDEIDFGEITLRDTLNNEATLSGRMYHRFFDDISFDNIVLNTNRLLVLNTTRKDNNQFYGKVIGRARMSINGTQDNILMDITGEPSQRDSSHIYIVSGNSIENETVDYIDFIQFGSEMEEKFRIKTAGSVVVDMKLTGNPSCKVDVILDEATGDVIKGEGEGFLRIRVGNKEPLTINGRYNITKGEYTFNFQTFLKKYFSINNGGSITWDGDPYQAKIDIVAEYLASNVDFAGLSSNSGFGAGTGSFNLKSDLRVLAHLTSTLLKPEIDFELQLPASSPVTDFFVLKRLEQFRQDKNELNKQITSLLLFNAFINPNQSLLSANATYSVLSSTIGGVVSGVVSGFLNSIIQKIPNLRFDVDLNTSFSSSTGNLQNNVEQLQAAARSKFIYTMLNGRLIITAGLNLDYNNPYANTNRNTNLLVTPDITVEWILSKSGRLRVVGFNRSNFDLVGQRNRTGVSLSYRRDFEKLPEIFKILFLDFSSTKKG